MNLLKVFLILFVCGIFQLEAATPNDQRVLESTESDLETAEMDLFSIFRKSAQK